jgi:hypothetical protein
VLEEPIPPADPTNWNARNEALRLEEWNVGIALLAASRRRLRFVLAGLAPRSALAEAARIADLGSQLARRAISRAEPQDVVSSITHDRFMTEYEEAIKAIVAGSSPEKALTVSHPTTS